MDESLTQLGNDISDTTKKYEKVASWCKMTQVWNTKWNTVFSLSQLSRVKAEARLALLSESVTGAELWLHNAMKQAEEELERDRHLSEQRKSTEDFSVCWDPIPPVWQSCLICSPIISHTVATRPLVSHWSSLNRTKEVKWWNHTVGLQCYS